MRVGSVAAARLIQPSLLTMVQSVELLFDDATDSAIRGEWQCLWDAGLPSQYRVRAESNRPHITLFVARAISQDVDDALIEHLPTPTFRLRLGGLVVFGSRQVTLARLAVPSRSLLAAHRAVFDAAAHSPGIPPHIRPGEWTPHVTLARRIPADDLGRAVRLLRTENHEILGHASVIRRWDGAAKREWPVTVPP